MKWLARLFRRNIKTAKVKLTHNEIQAIFGGLKYFYDQRDKRPRLRHAVEKWRGEFFKDVNSACEKLNRAGAKTKPQRG